MSLVAPIVDGVLQTETSTSTTATSTSTNGNEVDSDMFLTLLVAEMQNQDPLEPTSNTEWVSQYATFTQVEQMDELVGSMDLMRANQLVGKEVIMKVTSVGTGDTSYVRGTVDYVVYENGKASIVIGENTYSLDELDTVASDEYFDAYDKYTEFSSKVNALPDSTLMSSLYENAVRDIYELYNSLNGYEKEYMDAYASDYVTKYEACVEALEELGISMEITTEETQTSLDDVIENFNSKMEELMAQFGTLNSNITNLMSSQNSTGAGTEEAVEETDEVSDEVLDQLTEDTETA